jgi:hypothetical protein
MAEIKKQNVAAEHKKPPVAKTPILFTKENYKWMMIGVGVILLGLILMMGGKSNNPNEFHPNEVYSFTRITLAPIVILGGFVIEIYAIFRKPKQA